jgi:hypothetical protein
MGALVNVFKSLLGGILGFFGGLVGGKKDKAAPAKQGKKGKDGFYMVADDASMEELPVAAPVMVAAVSEVAEAPAAKAVKGKKEKTAVKAAPAKAPAQAARVMTPEELIIAALQPKSVEATAATAAMGTAGFATQYLVPTLTSGRRSPGPSLKMFKTMAKEIRG